MLHDPMFWYSVAFVIFLALAYRHGKKPILGWLDSEIAKIGGELQRARTLRAEAEALLADYTKKHAEAMSEAARITAHAREEAARLKAQAETDLKNALARHEQQAAQRLRMAETEALAAVRAAAVDQAMALARKTLAEQIDGAKAAAIADRAITDISRSVSTKAKAA